MSASSAFTIIYLCATIFHTEQAPLYFFALEQGVSLTYPMSHQYVKERGRQTERERERERERKRLVFGKGNMAPDLVAWKQRCIPHEMNNAHS